MITWDGEAIVAGWERGGCAEAECEATDPDKSMFLNDATAGAKLRHVGPATTAEPHRELHDPQVQHGAAPQRPLRGRQRTYQAGT